MNRAKEVVDARSTGESSMSSEEVLEKMKDVARCCAKEGITREYVKIELDNYLCSFSFAKVKKPTLETEGINSRIPKRSAHVLYLDYENVDENVPKEDAEAIQDIYECGNFYLYNSGREHAYHLMCFDYFTTPEVQEAQMNSNCDRAYYRGPLYNYQRGWVLRYKGKGDQPAPSFLGVLESPYEGKRLQSSFHVGFINKEYNLGIELTNPDGLDFGYIDKYSAAVKDDRVEPEEKERDEETNVQEG